MNMRHLDPTRNTRCKDRSRTLKSDIDLYLTARKYYLSRNTNALRECLNSFETAHVARNARRLMKHELAPCFDELLASEAFRHNFLLRSVHKLLNPFYFEQVRNYVHSTLRIWKHIWPNLAQLDASTARELEKSCPKYDQDDLQRIVHKLRNKEIFQNVSLNQEEMDNLVDRLRSIDLLIPSLCTLFSDLHVLEEVASCMHHIFQLPGDGDSISKAMAATFDHTRTRGLEQAESSLWLVARVHFQSFAKFPKKNKSELLAKLRPTPADSSALRAFASCALWLGFTSKKILQLSQGEMVDPWPNENRIPFDFPARKRAGFPDVETFDEDKNSLWVAMHKSASQDTLTSLFVLRSVCFHFFNSNLINNKRRRDDSRLSSTGQRQDMAADQNHRGKEEHGRIYFKEYQDSTWHTRAEATAGTVGSVARDLQASWVLYKIVRENGHYRIYPTIPDCCYIDAQESKINTIILSKNGTNPLDIETLLRLLYEEVL